MLAYVIMILAWPWAALAPINPLRGLLAFSEFNYSVRTVLDGQVYAMADVPRLYIPTYVMIRVPLLTLFGAALTMVAAQVLRGTAGANQQQYRDITLLSLTVIFPLACQVICHGPAFTGLRHFLFLIPLLAVLAGICILPALAALKTRRRVGDRARVSDVKACQRCDAASLGRPPGPG